MLFTEKVKQRMIPISNYSTVAEDATLQEAVLSLRKSYCELETGMCTEAGPRTILVIDKREQLVGILDFRSFPGGIGYSGTGGLKPTPWVPGGSGPALYQHPVDDFIEFIQRDNL